MVSLKISTKVISGKRNELLDTYRMIAEKTRQERGCHDFRVSQDLDHDNLVCLEETWENRSYLDEHFRSDIFSALLGAVKLLSNTYEIRVHDESQTEGMEAVDAARSRVKKEFSEQ